MSDYIGTREQVDEYIGSRLVEAAYLGSRKYFDAYSEITGTLPLTYESRMEHILKNYVLYGSASGSGTDTGNLLQDTYRQGTLTNLTYSYRCVTKIQIPVIQGHTYVVSLHKSGYKFKAYLLNQTGDTEWSNSSVLSTTDGRIVYESNYTTQSLSKEITEADAISMIIIIGLSSDAQLPASTVNQLFTVIDTASSTAPSAFVPHGFKILLTNTGENSHSETYPLYIGDSKLGAEEYIDYAEQKVYKDVSHPSIVRKSANVNIVNNGGGSWTLNHLPQATYTYEDVGIGGNLPLDKLSRLYYTIDVRKATSWGVRVCSRIVATGRISTSKKYLTPGTYTDYVDVTPTEDTAFGIVFNSTVVSGEGYDVTIHDMKICTPTDPPVSLPAILTYQGENTLSSTETLGECSVTGRINSVTP